MTSGKRHSVLIFCISPIKELYLEPINHYDPDRIIVFIGTKETQPYSVEKEIYGSTKLECNNIKEVAIDTTDYASVLTKLMDITDALENNYEDIDIFINISSGTHEFAAAGAFASMVRKNMIAFNVEISNYGIDKRRIKKIIKEISPVVTHPEKMKICDNEIPDDEIIVFLTVLRDMIKKTKYPAHAKIIKELKRRNAWTHNPEKKSCNERTPLTKREEMYLGRHYFDAAIKDELIADSKKKITFTKKGLLKLSLYGHRSDNKMLHIELPDDYKDNNICQERCITRVELNEERMRYSNIEMNELDDEIQRPEENVIEFERKGKKYRFRVGRE